MLLVAAGLWRLWPGGGKEAAAPAAPMPAVPSAAPAGGGETTLKEFNEVLAGWDETIRFWGRVVDQDGRPVEGVDLVASAATMRMIPTKDGRFRSQTGMRATSGADGTFQFEGAEGFSMTIDKIVKPGYVLPVWLQCAKPDQKYWYRFHSRNPDFPDFKPDPKNPEIVRLWKLKDPKPLRQDYIGFRILPEHPPREIRLNQRAGDVREVPDFTVEGRVEMLDGRPLWTLVFRSNGGGFVRPVAGDEFCFTAPSTGYQSVLEVRIDDPMDRKRLLNYSPGAQFRLFARTRMGRCYTGMWGYLSGSSESLRADLTAWTDPAGGTNLECDLSDFQLFLMANKLELPPMPKEVKK